MGTASKKGGAAGRHRSTRRTGGVVRASRQPGKAARASRQPGKAARASRQPGKAARTAGRTDRAARIPGRAAGRVNRVNKTNKTNKAARASRQPDKDSHAVGRTPRASGRGSKGAARQSASHRRYDAKRATAVSRSVGARHSQKGAGRGQKGKRRGTRGAADRQAQTRTATSRASNERAAHTGRAAGAAGRRKTHRGASSAHNRSSRRRSNWKRSNAALRLRRRRRWLRALHTGALLAVLVAVVLAGAMAVNTMRLNRRVVAPQSPNATAPAPVYLDMTGFDPEHIIDDEIFYDETAMSRDEIAAFIENINEGCQPGEDGTVCLAEAVFDTEDRDPSITCPGGYKGATGETAADIISKVALACDINPQVLLVLIQKEQGLLTASGPTLSAWAYEAAAGYGCPDGRSCNEEWAGFFAQIYGAASQFQRYRLIPEDFQVVAGKTTQVAYSPDAACGSSAFTAANQATAGLYAYTPYQPNAAAAAGGDECTSWGNWNFYGYFRRFFGDPTPST
ncbi:hypothetical protein [Actinomyces oricola]